MDEDLNPAVSINLRASLVPAAAVIPAQGAYTDVVAVKKLVVDRSAKGVLPETTFVVVFLTKLSRVCEAGWHVFVFQTGLRKRTSGSMCFSIRLAQAFAGSTEKCIGHRSNNQCAQP